MQRQQRNCGYGPCGMPNGHLSHWTHEGLRFCCREHKQAYMEDLERDKAPQLPLQGKDPRAYDVV